MTQQFQQMGVGGQPQMPPQPQQQAGVQMRLNPLQPVDISVQGQPFHVTDLDQAPPPIILPPNVGTDCARTSCRLTLRPVLSYAITARELLP